MERGLDLGVARLILRISEVAASSYRNPGVDDSVITSRKGFLKKRLNVLCGIKVAERGCGFNRTYPESTRHRLVRCPFDQHYVAIYRSDNTLIPLSDECFISSSFNTSLPIDAGITDGPVLGSNVLAGSDNATDHVAASVGPDT